METVSAPPIPRGLVPATAALAVAGWALFAVDPQAWPGLVGTVALSVVLLLNVGLSTHRRSKVCVVRFAQRRLLNPLVRTLYAIGLNPLGLVLLETRGRRSGRPRVVPVGNGRDGDRFWIVAEHGRRANWVRNVTLDPRVRVQARVGLRRVWLDGVATVLPEDDALARQWHFCRWHPLRLLNAMFVRVLGADLLTVRVDVVR